MKQKGFTLIELLAVIVILAIIALIATPIVLNIIKDTKESSQLQSAQFYIDAAEMAITKKMMDDPTFEPTTCEIQSDGNLKCGETLVEVEITGETPSSGTITLEEGEITGVTLVLSEKTIVKNNEGKLVYGESAETDANATPAACFEVEPIYEYEIGASCDAYVQMLFDDEELTCIGLTNETGDFLTSLKYYVYWGEIEYISIEELEEAGAITNVKDTNTVSITNYTCGGLEDNKEAIRDIVIPSKINGKTVTKIDINAFFSYDSDENLIEEKIINSVVIPDSVISIENFAFGYNELTSVILGNKVTSIGKSAFYGCSSLEKITIPNSITSIGESAFTNCTSLKEITLPNSITSIRKGVFETCTSLEKITIPNSVASIGNYAFSHCENLKTINYTGTQEQWGSISKGSSWNYGWPSDYVINYNYVVQ